MLVKKRHKREEENQLCMLNCTEALITKLCAVSLSLMKREVEEEEEEEEEERAASQVSV